MIHEVLENSGIVAIEIAELVVTAPKCNNTNARRIHRSDNLDRNPPSIPIILQTPPILCTTPYSSHRNLTVLALYRLLPPLRQLQL
mmetsp:Transcript_14108/g.38972  ORF Transcript_14108/g.38972 Transcript_14108/m.38972 type:complete len:86 (-) Transcript_14108:430-687(-)